MSVDFCDLLASLSARLSGASHTACCPAHDDRHPSLSIACRDGTLLFHCFVGCSYRDIVQALELRGLWPVTFDDAPVAQPAADNGKWRLQIDRELIPASRTRAERYLRSRGISIGSPDLAYHPKLFHPPTGTAWPAMVACIRDVRGNPMALQATYLRHIDPPGKAPIEPVRVTTGRLRGHAVHLAPAGPTLLIGEGIETVASGMAAAGLPGWAALGTANMGHLELPEAVREVIILSDADAAGEYAAWYAASRFTREGRRVRIARPSIGSDFNDALREAAQ